MWKVSLPCNKDALKHVEIALTYHDKTLKYEMQADEYKNLSNLYDRYDNLLGVAHDDLEGKTFKADTKQAIHSAYSEIQEQGRLKQLRSTLLLATDYCPICSINQADELDHHLPRSVYNLLALYSRNLVPICHKCNNKKRAVTGVNSNERFIHVYYDKIPQDVQFFCMKHLIVDRVLTFEFFVADIPELEPQLRQQMIFQIGRVNLNKRLKKEVNTLLSSLAIGLNMVYTSTKSAPAVQKFLLENSQFFRIKYGINDWRTVTLRTLSDCPIFCDGGFIKVLGLDEILGI